VTILSGLLMGFSGCREYFKYDVQEKHQQHEMIQYENLKREIDTMLSLDIRRRHLTYPVIATLDRIKFQFQAINQQKMEHREELRTGRNTVETTQTQGISQLTQALHNPPVVHELISSAAASGVSGQSDGSIMPAMSDMSAMHISAPAPTSDSIDPGLGPNADSVNDRRSNSVCFPDNPSVGLFPNSFPPNLVVNQPSHSFHRPSVYTSGTSGTFGTSGISGNSVHSENFNYHTSSSSSSSSLSTIASGSGSVSGSSSNSTSPHSPMTDLINFSIDSTFKAEQYQRERFAHV